MKEEPEDRLKRLRAKKAELLEKMKNLRLPSVRNANHKRNILNDEVNRIGTRIVKIQEAIKQ